jgi:hypothetical protein
MFKLNYRRPKFRRKPWAGTSTFPTSVDNKTALTDGIDIIEADNVNNAYVPINSIETFIGASGAAQSHNTDILAQIFASLPTIKFSYTDAATISASVGISRPQNSGGTVRKMRRLTSAASITFADIDTGAEANSTAYYIWGTGDTATTVPVFKISTSASAPTGMTHYELLGGFYNDGSGNIIENSIWSIAGMQVRQVKRKEIATVITVNAATPHDNSKPQIGEGVSVLDSDVFCPSVVGSKVLVLVTVPGTNSAGGNILIAHLHENSGADAVSAYANHQASTSSETTAFSYWKVITALTPIIFNLRAGCAATFYINADGAGTQLFAGINPTSITIVEFV